MVYTMFLVQVLREWLLRNASVCRLLLYVYRDATGLRFTASIHCIPSIKKSSSSGLRNISIHCDVIKKCVHSFFVFKEVFDSRGLSQQHRLCFLLNGVHLFLVTQAFRSRGLSQRRRNSARWIKKCFYFAILASCMHTCDHSLGSLISHLSNSQSK